MIIILKEKENGLPAENNQHLEITKCVLKSTARLTVLDREKGKIVSSIEINIDELVKSLYAVRN